MSVEYRDGTEITTGRRKPSALVAEYDAKAEAIPAAHAEWEAAIRDITTASTVGGTYPGMTLPTGRLSETDMRRALLSSAWRHCWNLYDLDTIASAETKRRVYQMFEAPPPFTVENIREQFGDLVADPWGSVLRGLAEVFSQLDPAFKSHEKMKIGVKGLPKRVILPGVGGHGGWGRDKLRDILNALAAYQRKPLVEYAEIAAVLENGDAIRDEWTEPKSYHSKETTYPGRGVWLKRFSNGNGHLFFGDEALRDINRALAEFYGDVLPDCPDERPTKKQAGTEVSRDLQYYPTPKAVVDRIIAEGRWQGMRVLEPSCGCGRIMDGLRKAGAAVFGIEVDAGRVAQCEAKGHKVMRWNFLDVQPNASTGMANFDAVVMNPPFYGRHYAKHIRHALRFVKAGGLLVSILPATARYDHGELDDLRPRWYDLPVAAFAESGTNIATTIATIRVGA